MIAKNYTQWLRGEKEIAGWGASPELKSVSYRQLPSGKFLISSNNKAEISKAIPLVEKASKWTANTLRAMISPSEHRLISWDWKENGVYSAGPGTYNIYGPKISADQYKKFFEAKYSAAYWRQVAKTELYARGGSTLQLADARIEQYKKIYLEHPDILPWAGLAAITAREARRAIVGIPNAGWRLKPAVQMVSDGGMAIYASLYWVMRAYVELGDEAMDVFRQWKETKQLSTSLFEAFKYIDIGRKQLGRGNHKAGEAFVWTGNFMLAFDEQKTALQQVFDADPKTAEMFQHVFIHANIPNPVRSFRGSPALSFSQFKPFGQFTFGDFTSFADRWNWVTSEIWPRWEKMSKQWPSAAKKLVRDDEIPIWARPSEGGIP